MKGKISGAMAGLLLTGNPLGMIAGGLSGHYLVDVSSLNTSEAIIQKTGLLGAITVIIFGYFRANKKLNRSAAKWTTSLLSSVFHLSDEQKGVPSAIFPWARKKMTPSDMQRFIHFFKQEVAQENQIIPAEFVYYAAAMNPPRQKSAQTYIAFIEESLVGQEELTTFLRQKYSEPMLNAYQVLGASPFSSFEAVRKCYVSLARKFHPDAGSSNKENTMMAINNAWNKIRQTYVKAHLIHNNHSI